MVIKSITARKILASQGDDTIEATINDIYTASVPAGISAGKYEIAKVSPDEGISQISQISQNCSGKDWTQETLDAEIASHNFGGNATLAVSAAFFKSQKITPTVFPKLMLLLFEGGEHGNKNLSIQEFLLIEDSVTQASEDFARLKYYLKQNNIETLVGAEGGFSPTTFNNDKAIEVIRTVFPNGQISLDMAASFHDSEIPENIFSIEDPYDDESWHKWTDLVTRHSSLVIGDDLTASNPQRIQKAIDLKAITGVVIKPNQIGTISGAVAATRLAQQNNLKVIVSHRGDETNDTWIVDFALFVGADFVKLGGMDRGERVAKYNRLLEFQHALSPRPKDS